MTFPSQQISVSIDRTPEEVYAFASNPENLPSWATGLSGSIAKMNAEWMADSPIGKIKIKLVEKNNFGVLDHDVTLPSGEKFYNPMRVFRNDKGCEVVFTLYRQPGTSDEAFSDDAKTIQRDLKKLKTLLEQ
ncbi:MAG: hypothetical protein ACD_28C00060G0005 [uncultured bacterium]|nr:MAG: hypothetical protein ACD_28C00060G0005 [uncultured bacterium]